MSIFSQTLSLLNRAERRRGLLVLLMIMGMALLETVGIASVMPFLAVLGNPDLVQSNPILRAVHDYAQRFGVSNTDDFLVLLGISSFALIILSAVYRTFTQYAMNRFIEMRQHSLGVRLLEQYLRQPYEFYLNRHSGELAKNVLSEVSQLIIYVLRPGYNIMAYGLVIIAVVILLVLANPWMALLIASVLGGLYMLVYSLLRGKMKRLGDTRFQSNTKRYNVANEVFGEIKVLKLLGREYPFLQRFQVQSQQLAASQALYQTLSTVPNYLIEAFIFGTMLLFTIVLLSMSGGLNSGALGEVLPVLGLYAFGAYRLKPSVSQIYYAVIALKYGQTIVDHLYRDLQDTSSSQQLLKHQPSPLAINDSIQLENITYVYPESSKAILRGINLTIPKGSFTGIVGSTGAGKTTLVDVFLGLLRPSSGKLLVDGKFINETILPSWQQSIGYVPQEIVLNDATVAENIALGIPPRQVDREQIVRCAKMAQLDEFITHDLPEGYDTLVGERGVRLSGGQRQRVGIARALYHEPEVLVFDEATSALDALTEQAVMESIDALSHQKTVILIAHRLGTVKRCDQIVLLEQGRIKAKGTFEELKVMDDQFRAMIG